MSTPASHQISILDSEQIKITLCGDGATGKTSLLWNYTTDSMLTTYEPTIFDTMQCNVLYKDKPLALTLFDLAGQEEYEHVRVLTYPHTHVFLLLYSTISPHSFHNISTLWLPEVRRCCPGTPVVLVGTKVDLRGDEEVLRRLQTLPSGPLTPISTARGQALAEQLGCDGFIEVSSITGDNVQECFAMAFDAHAQHQQNLAAAAAAGGRWRRKKANGAAVGTPTTSHRTGDTGVVSERGCVCDIM